MTSALSMLSMIPMQLLSGNFKNKSPVWTPYIFNNYYSILSFIPQYLVITVSEIMVSVTGVEWAYTEAPPTMKARDSQITSRRTVQNLL